MKTISIRTSLLRSFLTLILATSLTILAVMTYGARRTVHQLSETLIDQSSRHARDELSNFFGVVDGMLRTSRAWWDEGLVAYEVPGDLPSLNDLFLPILRENVQITSMMLAHDGGFEYLLFRDLRGGDDYEWYNRIVWADRGPEASFEARFTHDLDLHSKGPLPEEAVGYDPRTRPFYTEPTLDEIHWTAPYYFFVTRDAGMTASIKWRDAATGQIRLVAFDLLLMDLSHFTSSLRPSANGQVFVLHADGSVLGLPADDRWHEAHQVRTTLRHPGERLGGNTTADQAATLSTPGELQLGAIEAVVDVWKGLEHDDLNHFEFTVNDERWWAGLRPFDVSEERLWIGVVVPESDFLGQAYEQRMLVLIVSGVAILAAILLTTILARRYSRPLEQLAAQSARVRELNLTDSTDVQSPLREVSELAEANAQMVTALESFSRYVPMDLVRQLMRRGEVARIGGRDADLTILFTDVAGFTSVSERMPPQQLTDHMAEYFDAMLAELHRENATVDKFVGDAVVAFWGAPEADPDQAKHAVRAVLRCRERLREMNTAWERRGLPALPTRFGLSAGKAVVGNVGSPDRLNYTVLGDTVNMASRLEGLNGRYGTSVLATEHVVEAAGPDFAWRAIDRVAVKGKTEAVTIYEPLGETANVSEDDLRRAGQYEAALASYAEGRFVEAAAWLDRLLASGPDPAAERLRDLCRQYADDPPRGSWTGVTKHEVK